MKNLEEYYVNIISDKEKLDISGGRYWNPFFLALYIIDEVYDGLTRECDSSCSHR
ncbi:MAG: hypothetical protein L3J08_02130 [Flavobacteriaceae bacterium]|nr:hypothetical protein [Flavobacteriaceae bacterium]